MKVISSTILLIVTFGIHGFAQVNAGESLEKAAKQMISSIVSEDYATYIDLVYPTAVEVFGGKDIMVKMTKTNKDAQKDAGLILAEADFIKSSPILNNNLNLQSIITFDYKMSIGGQNYKGQNYLFAISEDLGSKWFFVELETFDEESIKTFVPSYNANLEYPMLVGAQLIQDK